MQKILYIAHMFYMGLHDGDLLVEGFFEAWDLGPVHPDLYHEAKIYGARPVGNFFYGIDDVDDDVGSYLDRSVDHLSRFTGSKLIGITHWEHGAWSKNYIPGAKGIEIPNQDIWDEYKRRVAMAEEKNRRNSE